MSNQKRLSQVSLAAIAFLAAAMPCLAQTESNNRNNAIDKSRSTEIAALRNDHLNVRKAEAKSTPAQTADASRERFNAAIAEATSSTSGFASKATFTESDWQKMRTLSKEFDSAAARSITFVPSRGQKLPD